MTLRYQRLRAPGENGQTLQIPPLDEFGQTLQANRETLASHRLELDGRSIAEVRAAARGELVPLAREYSARYGDVSVPDDARGLLLAGHQPTLFHPGVWYKNFALDALARRHHLVGVNLVIDNDHNPLRSIRVPVGSLAEPRIALLKFDSRVSSGPFETEVLYSPSTFESFGQRVAEAVEPFVSRPLIRQLWPLVLEARQEVPGPSMSIAAGRHRLETGRGLANLEIPLSRICQTRSFAGFVAELLTRADEFRRCHNRSLDEYREIHGIRSSAHPVPQLEKDDGWVELPFWIWGQDHRQRQRLFVRSSKNRVIISDRNAVSASLEPARLADQVFQLRESGVHLRTRALLTTMYSRLVLSDGFLHGIGGAKYDQLTDQIMRRFFQIEPPAFHTVTATHRLPLDLQMTEPAELTEVQTRLRHLRFHAERFGDPADERFGRLVAEKAAHLNALPASGSRQVWHDEMVSINEQLQALLGDTREALQQRLRRTKVQLQKSRLLGSREFSFCLFDDRLPDRLRV